MPEGIKTFRGGYPASLPSAGRTASVQASVDMTTGWPLDSVFVSVTAVNPTRLLGFGTWEAVGQQTVNRVIIYYWKRTA